MHQLPRMAGNPSDGGSTTREGQKRPLHAEVQSLGVRTWMSRSPPPNVIVLEPRGLKTSRKILVIAKKGSCQGSCQLWAKSNQPLQSRTGQNMDTHASQANGSSLMVVARRLLHQLQPSIHSRQEHLRAHLYGCVSGE